MTQKRNIAIVCGGYSSEHEVSLRSAQGIYSFFDKERYNVYIVEISKEAWWVNVEETNNCQLIRTTSRLT